MTIYTGKGDSGTTCLYGGKTVLKSDLQVEACGTVDELSAAIVITINQTKHRSLTIKSQLTIVQKNLYQIMAYLAGATINLSLINQATKQMEKTIDYYEKQLSPLNRFILPQGNDLCAWLHLSRAVCRRAERKVVAYLNRRQLVRLSDNYLPIIRYLNRLSDYLYILARFVNQGREVLA